MVFKNAKNVKNAKMTDVEATVCDIKSETKHLEFFGARHTLAIMGFFACCLNYAFRVNLSVAIVAMTNSSTSDSSTSNTCPIPDDHNSSKADEVTGEFDWDESTQGVILGSFFYGYIFTTIFGGLAAERFGGRMVAGLSILAMGVLTVLSPWAAHVSSSFLIVIRILEGCVGGAFYPALNCLMTNWYPVMERGKFASFIYSGISFGTVVTLSASGWLCSSDFLGGWPSAFYTFAFPAVVWGVCWFWLIRDRAEDHPSISDAERKYIMQGCPIIKEERVSPPWKSILTSKYVWAIAIAHFGEAWGFYTIITDIPMYLDRILHIDMQKNGMFSAMPYIGCSVFTNIYGVTTEYLVTRGILSILSIRRMSMIIGGYVPMLCLLGMCYVNCTALPALVLLFISGTLNGSVTAGYLSSHADIAPRFAGTLMGLTCAFAGIAGILTPMLTGILTNDNQTLWAWRKVFLTSSLMYFVSTTIYVLFITAETQPWNEPKLRNDKDSEK